MAPTLDEKTVRHVANLARLNVPDEEIARYAEQLTAVLRHMDQLNEVDTTDVEPTAHAAEVANVFREDQQRSSITSREALHNAPSQQQSMFKVPKVLDQEKS